MNLGQLIKRVHDKTGAKEDTIQYLNDAQVELRRQSNLITRTSASAVDGEITIPSTALIVHDVMWDEDTRLDYYPEGGFPVTPATGTPVYWTEINNTIYLNPKNSGTDTVYLINTPAPTDMSSNSDTPSLANADNALIAYACWQHFEDDGIDDLAERWEAKFFKEADRWLQLDKARHKRPRKVRVDSWS